MSLQLLKINTFVNGFGHLYWKYHFLRIFDDLRISTWSNNFSLLPFTALFSNLNFVVLTKMTIVNAMCNTLHIFFRIGLLCSIISNFNFDISTITIYYTTIQSFIHITYFTYSLLFLFTCILVHTYLFIFLMLLLF